VGQALSPANSFSFSIFITFGGPQAHDHSVEDAVPTVAHAPKRAVFALLPTPFFFTNFRAFTRV
jgi:hypothetical protein